MVLLITDYPASIFTSSFRDASCLSEAEEGLAAAYPRVTPPSFGLVTVIQ